MIRGTTPTLNFKLPFEIGLLDVVYITFSQDKEIIIDISDSTVTPETLDVGVTAYSKTGEKIEGTRNNTFNYSTDEEWAGNYWFDGKKLYYKAIQFNTGSILKYSFTYSFTYKAHLFVEFNQTDLNEVIFYRGITNDNELVEIDYINDSGFRIDLLNNSIDSGWIFICYTKNE